MFEIWRLFCHTLRSCCCSLFLMIRISSPHKLQEVEALKELEERTVMEAFGNNGRMRFLVGNVGKCRKATRRADTSRRIYRDFLWFFWRFWLGILRGYRTMMDHVGTERYYRYLQMISISARLSRLVWSASEAKSLWQEHRNNKDRALSWGKRWDCHIIQLGCLWKVWESGPVKPGIKSWPVKPGIEAQQGTICSFSAWGAKARDELNLLIDHAVEPTVRIGCRGLPYGWGLLVGFLYD